MALSNVVTIGCGDERTDPRTGSGAVASVDLDAVAHNVRVLQQFAGDAAVMAVVKADGYSHGAVEVAHAAVAAGGARARASPPSVRPSNSALPV